MVHGDSIRVDRIVRRKNRRPGEELEVLLSDASSFFAAMRVWEDEPFHEGDELPPEQIERIQHNSALIAVRSRALSLLSRSEQSRFILTRKLWSRGFEPQIVESVLDNLEETGLLDDGRYAISWVRDRIRRHPEGRSALVGGLRQRGVSSVAAEMAVDVVLSEEGTTAEEAARALAVRLFRNPKLDAAGVSVRMVRRGFSYGLVRDTIREVAGSDPHYGDIPDSE